MTAPRHPLRFDLGAGPTLRARARGGLGLRARWLVGLAVGLAAGSSCGDDSFACGDDLACQGATPGGVCVDGSCAFPSDACDSGLVYGEHSGARAGECVSPAAADDTAGPGGTSAATPPGEATSPGEPTPPGEATSGDSESSGASPGEVEFADDELLDEFEAGTFEGTEWADGRLALEAGADEGQFTSRVFDAGEVAQWQTVQWRPDGPYGKPLPDLGGREQGYLDGGADMAENVMLMHFDGGGLWEQGAQVLDTSGRESHGVLMSDSGPAGSVPGVFGAALDDHGGSWVSIPTGSAAGLHFGDLDFTWSLWFRTSTACAANEVFMGVDDSDMPMSSGPHLWLGCTDDQWTGCDPIESGARAAGTFKSQHAQSSDGANFCGSRPVGDDRWHHVAVTKQGHDGTLLQLYVDGRREYQNAGTFSAPIEYTEDPGFTIGALSRGTYNAAGAFDEAAVWLRALDDAEIEALHRRGATGVTVSVRGCDEPGCADEPAFVGEWVDPPGALAPETPIPLEEVASGRYVQYRIRMSRQDPEFASPRVASVTLRGTR